MWGIYIYLFSWHVIGIFNSLWFVIDIFNCSWSVNRQLTVNCDSIVLFTVNCDYLSNNPINCNINITRDTWFRLLSVKYLGVAEIYIRIIVQNVPILMIFSQIFRGACPRTPPPLRFRSSAGLIHHQSSHRKTPEHTIQTRTNGPRERNNIQIPRNNNKQQRKITSINWKAKPKRQSKQYLI